MGLSSATSEVIDERIIKTKQLANPADRSPRIAIYERRSSPQNSKVYTHTLIVDAIVPLETQRSKGLALDMSERIKGSLNKKPIGRRLFWDNTLEDQPTAYGWYKTSVIFTYNTVEN